MGNAVPLGRNSMVEGGFDCFALVMGVDQPQVIHSIPVSIYEGIQQMYCM